MKQRGLVWFTHDLRLDENPVLSAAQRCDELFMAYIVDPRWFQPSRYGLAPMGYQRWRFLQDALTELNQQLLARGQRLHLLYGKPEALIPALLHDYRLDTLFASKAFGWNELQIQRRACAGLAPEHCHLVSSSTLFDAQQLAPLSLQWPQSFTQFRKQVATLPLLQWPAPQPIPKAVTQRVLTVNQPSWLPKPSKGELLLTGGMATAQRHWDEYQASAAILNYKSTRNDIDEWSASSKLSAWLNQGALPVRRLYRQIAETAAAARAPEQVSWLNVELLWREFFQWLGLAMGTGLFRCRGFKPNQPLTSFYPERFQKWCYGRSPWPLINAIMNQLRATGYISNRARQIAASALVNEMGIDWRYGAAWFEHHLLDYDVNVNWGNWQYLAGVGVDPRGGRHFDIDKQEQLYDRNQDYQRRWTQVADCTALDHQDPTGWPIG